MPVGWLTLMAVRATGRTDSCRTLSLAPRSQPCFSPRPARSETTTSTTTTTTTQAPGLYYGALGESSAATCAANSLTANAGAEYASSEALLKAAFAAIGEDADTECGGTCLSWAARVATRPALRAACFAPRMPPVSRHASPHPRLALTTTP